MTRLRGLFVACLPPVVMAFAAVPPLAAQEFPTERYTSADGLPQDVINRVLYDPRGFLWIGGTTAITRFDGLQFTSYGRAEGLELSTGVNDMCLDERGDLWVATNGAGIIRLDRTTTDSTARFTRLAVGPDRSTNRVNRLLRVGNQVWAGTDAGLFVGDSTGAFRRVPLPREGEPGDARQIVALASSASVVWVGTGVAAFRCDRETTVCKEARPGWARTLLVDPEGRLWIGGRGGIERWNLDASGALVGPPVLATAEIRARNLSAASDGVIAATDDRRVAVIGEGPPRILISSIEAMQVNDTAEDPSGNVWVATTSGLIGVRRQGITLFTQQRLRSPDMVGLRRDAAGRPFAISRDLWVDRVDGDRITAVRLLLPPGVSRSSWPQSSVHIDAAGEIWLGTSAGLLRYAPPPSSQSQVEVRPRAAYTVADGLAGRHISEVFEDSRGNLWIPNVPAEGDTLTVWHRQARRFERFGPAQGLPPGNQLHGLVEDRTGAVWARLREGGMVRIAGKRATVFDAAHGLPRFAFASFVDSRGRLWVSGSDMLVRIDDPGAAEIRAQPVLRGLTAAILSIAEGPSGELFLGSYDGLLEFEPETGTLARFSRFEGFPGGTVDALAAEPGGTLLAMAGRTLVRVDRRPKRREQTLPLRCILSGVRAGGEALPLPEAGVPRVEPLDLQPTRNQIEIQFVGLSSRLSEPLTYEYRLLGVTDRWMPTPERRVTFAGLAPGRYTFEVRAIGSDGTSVSAPAGVSFRVLPPWYRRAWFLTLAGVTVLLGAYAAHRGRLAQVVRTERLRSRIATDLHDDIGASLSQIAILAEVARRRAGDNAAISGPLSSIAATSRDLVDAMSDIVWAVNPHTDTLSDLVHRMRRFAAETLGGVDIDLQFTAPEDVELKLGADTRREIYLILKESVNNIARHSGATEAIVRLSLARHELTLEIQDNGRGFDPDVGTDGNGLASMRKRAAAFGGVLTIDSVPGRGTRVKLVTDLRRHPL